MRKLLIVAPYQFGELSDCYYWAKYAKSAGWSVTYLGYRYQQTQRAFKERSCSGVRVVGVKHSTNRLVHGLRFLAAIVLEIILHNHQNVIVCRFPMCNVLPRLFPNRNIVLDVRTLSVSPDKYTRDTRDNELRRIMHCFRQTTVISRGVGEKLGGKCPILPLGAEPLSKVPKRFDSLRLFYIGTFNNRNLSKFIEGLALYQAKTGDKQSTFDIVGGGTNEEQQAVIEAVERTGVTGIKLHGYLTHEEAQPFFDKCNVGVCYVPVTDYYQHQPPTKLYEYLLSGMACLATDTISNRDVMNENNGVVIGDTPQAVCEGLIKVQALMADYSSATIVNSAKKYHWQTIVQESLLPIFHS